MAPCDLKKTHESKMAIEQQVQEIEADAGKAIASASDEAALEAIRVAELGKKGRVSLLMRAGRYCTPTLLRAGHPERPSSSTIGDVR